MRKRIIILPALGALAVSLALASPGNSLAARPNPGPARTAISLESASRKPSYLSGLKHQAKRSVQKRIMTRKTPPPRSWHLR